MPRKVIRAVLLLAGAVLTLVLTAAVAPAKTPGGKLSKEEAALLQKAHVSGDKTVTLLVAAQPGQTKTVVDGLQGLGATIRYRDDELGYIRADVPTDKVKEAFALSGVLASDIDTLIPLPDPRPENISPVARAAGSGRRDAAAEPVHADPGHGRGAVRRREPDLGRSRRHDRHRRHRRLARPSEPHDHQHRRGARSSTGSPAPTR